MNQGPWVPFILKMETSNQSPHNEFEKNQPPPPPIHFQHIY
jgi:hypothetical protein